MKKLRNKGLAFWNSILATLLSFLGFSCDHPDMYGVPPIDDVAMYGCPQAEYVVRGEVKSADDSKPLENMQVVINRRNISDTLYTDSEGNYELVKSEFPIDSVYVTVSDTAEVYEAQTKGEKLNYEGGDGAWYDGHAEVVVDFELKKKKSE